MSILVVHGPNLNLLGNREPDKYGKITLTEINNKLIQIAKKHNISLDTFQSNIEGELINKIHEAANKYEFIIINPAAFTHTSIALRDAILAVNKPFIEVHISNIYKRESFRHKSFFSDIAIGVISGLGEFGYEIALNYAINNHFLKG